MAFFVGFEIEKFDALGGHDHQKTRVEETGLYDLHWKILMENSSSKSQVVDGDLVLVVHGADETVGWIHVNGNVDFALRLYGVNHSLWIRAESLYVWQLV